MPRKQEMTLNQGVRKLILEHYKGTKSESTSTMRLYQVMEVLGSDTLLKDVDERDINNMKQVFKAMGNSHSTVNRKLAALSKLLNEAHSEWLVIDRKPAIKKLKEEKVDIHLVSKREEAVMLEFFDERYPRAGAMVRCLIDTGCRLSELSRIDAARDVNWDDELLTVRDTKNGAPSRLVPMTERVQQVLSEWVYDKGENQPFDRNKQYYRHRWDMMRPTLNKVGDKTFHLHCLRHTCATRLLKAGVALPIVSRWLGHSTLDMTMRYLRLIPDDLLDARNALKGLH